MRPLFYALLLSGCALLPPNSYEWFRDDSAKSVWYRWKVVERAAFKNFCGRLTPDTILDPVTDANGDGACALRIALGAVLPGDRNIYTGEVATARIERPLCIVFATMSEESAKRMTDRFRERDLWSHEVEMHCQRGLDHKEVTK